LQIVHATFRSGEGQEAVELLDTLGLDIEDYKLLETKTGDLLIINLLYDDIDVLLDNLSSKFDFAHDKERSLVIFTPDSVIPRDEKKLEKVSSRITRESLVTYTQDNSELNMKYVVLVIAASVITSLGLILDNVAVIVGSMVIAPVLGPLLGITIGIVLGDNRLIKQGLLAEIAGTMLAIIVGFVIGIIIPHVEITNSLAVRMNPTLADLFIAIAAGAASAYSLIKDQLKTGIVGVMVAAALVPVMSTIGIGIAVRNQSMIYGAFLLLGGNFLGLLLSNMIVLYFEGIRPQVWYKFKAKEIIKKSLIFILIAIIIFSVPLGFMTVYQFHREMPVEIVNNTVKNYFQGEEAFHLVNVEVIEEQIIIYIYVLNEQEIAPDILEAIKKEIRYKLEQEYKLNFKFIPIIEMDL